MESGANRKRRSRNPNLKERTVALFEKEDKDGLCAGQVSYRLHYVGMTPRRAERIVDELLAEGVLIPTGESLLRQPCYRLARAPVASSGPQIPESERCAPASNVEAPSAKSKTAAK